MNPKLLQNPSLQARINALKMTLALGWQLAAVYTHLGKELPHTPHPALQDA